MDILESFRTLEVESTDSPEEIAGAYRDLVRVWHPDRFASTPRLQEKANEKLMRINEAYRNVLSYLDNAKRTQAETVIPRSTAAARPRGQSTSPLKVQGALPRFAARVFDYCLWAVVLRQAGVFSLFPDLGVPLISVPMLVIFSWILPESMLLRATGATPGKWFFSLKIVHPDGVSFLRALRRSTAVWCHGMAIGIPFLAPATIAVAFKTLSRTPLNIWDRDAGTRVDIGAPSSKKLAVAGICFAAFISFSTVGDETRRPYTAQTAGTATPAAESAESDSTLRDVSTLRETATPHKEGARYDLAIDALSGLRAINPEDPEVHRELGTLMVHAGRIDDAVEVFSSLTALAPDDPEAHHMLGKTLAKAGDPHAAVKALVRCIKLSPLHKKARHSLGLSHVALGRPLEAIAQYRALLGLDKKLADELLDYLYQAFGAVAL